jgi:hypothetical protein
VKGYSPMETNETLKRILMHKAEGCIDRMLKSMEEGNEEHFQELEQSMQVESRKFGRSCLEAVLEEKAREQGSAARREGGCGHRQRLVGSRPRQILTILGPIVVHRAYYQCMRDKEDPAEGEAIRCTHGEAPFDRQWGWNRQRSSPGVQKAVSYLSAHLTLEGVAEAVTRLLALDLSARQVLNLIQPIGEAFLRQENEYVQEVLKQGASKHTSEAERQSMQAESIKRLYVETDGVFARVRRGSVVMEKEEQEREGDVYRDIKVGAVFVGQPGRERSELAPGVFVDTPGPIQYVARRTTADAFAPLLYALAQREGIMCAQQVVVLGDGARWIWRLAEEQFPGAVQIVDEYHAREHVWEVARAAFAAEPSQKEGWATHVIDLLSTGQIEEVIRAIERLPPMTPPPGKSRSVADTEAEYFRTNAERMRYPLFRAQGMHVGSGIAEAACKVAVSTRAKRAGMRWTPDGLDAILALRTSVLNGSFDQRWQKLQEAA